MEEVLTIGKLSAQTNIGVSTIRFYEQKGLVDGPPRNKSGYRLYPPSAVTRLLFVKKSRDLGFSLRQVGELIRFSGEEEADGKVVELHLQTQYTEVCAQFEQLTWQRNKLEKLLEDCRSFEDGTVSPRFVEIMLDD